MRTSERAGHLATDRRAFEPMVGTDRPLAGYRRLDEEK